jgi:hypothetical protein
MWKAESMNVRARLGLTVAMATAMAIVFLVAPLIALAELPSDYNTVFKIEGQTPGDLYYQPDPDNPVPVWLYYFNTTTPSVTFSAETTESRSTTVPVDIGGFTYTVDRQATQILPLTGVPATNAPPFTSFAPRTGDPRGLDGAPLSDGSLRLEGWVGRLTTPYWTAGMHDPAEGRWYMHVRSIASRWGVPYGKEAVSPFFIDVTPPIGEIYDVHIAREATPGASAIVSQTVCDVVWSNSPTSAASYDELSGDGSWDVQLNDADPINFPSVVAWSESAFTVEDMTPGLNTVKIACVDMAGNIGPYTPFQIYCDPDTPTVSFTRPTGSVVGVKAPISVDATDGGGISSVVYTLDGTNIGMPASAPYTITPNLSAFSSDTTHTLRVVVTDLLGRTAEASKTVTIDKTAPVISRLKASVSKRVVTLSVRVSEPSVIGFAYNVTTKSSGAKLVTKKATHAGTYSIKFTVPKPAAKSHVFWIGMKVPYAAQAVDAAGNSSKALTGRVKVYFYKLVKTKNNQVKVIYY